MSRRFFDNRRPFTVAQALVPAASTFVSTPGRRCQSLAETLHSVSYTHLSVANDPTTKDRQGPDWGRQYRSAIWFADAEQEKIARAYVQQLSESKVFNAPIVTEISPLTVFYPAEDYHQHYVQNHPLEPYVVANSLPKLQKLKKAYPQLLKK